MKKFAIEIKWGFIFSGVMLLWMVMEKLLGLHGQYIDKHAVYTNLFAIPAIVVFVFALLDKRKNFYNGKMSWLDGFLSGLGISIIVAILSPLVQYITLVLISPGYFPNIIAYSVESGNMSPKVAATYFTLSNYMMQSSLSALLIGAITSALVALFVRRK